MSRSDPLVLVRDCTCGTGEEVWMREAGDVVEIGDVGDNDRGLRPRVLVEDNCDIFSYLEEA